MSENSLTGGMPASEIVKSHMTSDIVPSPVTYSVLLPDNYDTLTEKLPLLILLHGGKSSSEALSGWKEVFDELWAEGEISPVVVAMASTGQPTIPGRTEYVDRHDGSERWYSFILGPFLNEIRSNYNVSSTPSATAIGGISMGGLGAIRFGVAEPRMFAAVAAWEPSVLPAFRLRDVKPRNRFHYSDEFLRKIFGTPPDENWEQSNPAWIAKKNAQNILDSKVQIYLECGDVDYFNLNEGTEFLHRVLLNCGIKHEYHSVRGADHLGVTLKRRRREGILFIDRALRPSTPDTTPALLEMIELWKARKVEAESRAENAEP